MKLRFLTFLATTLILFQTQAASQIAYKTGITQMKEIGVDIYNLLAPSAKQQVSATPISYESSSLPIVRVMQIRQQNEIINGLWVSDGFLALANGLAHAKAIDRYAQRGYFKRYSAMLAASDEKIIPPLPDLSNPAFWSDRVMNDQMSNFNSIVAYVFGLKIAHHYLGHFQKYGKYLSETSSITAYLTLEEWQEALRSGMFSALNAGCTIEGIQPFLQAISDMPNRPGWSEFFMPRAVSFAAVNKELKKAQRKFFSQ